MPHIRTMTTCWIHYFTLYFNMLKSLKGPCWRATVRGRIDLAGGLYFFVS